jgi:mannose-6-phosphate isomerase-like protein (cupin superfamily)
MKGKVMSDRLTTSNALNKLAATAGKEFITLLKHGSLKIEIYKPDKIDNQMPHSKNEIYVIVSGSGTFVKGEEKQPFEPGEILFVPAFVEHHFEDFSKDFATWVLFYGPEGGEK